MLTNDLRPTKWEEVVGQELVIKILKAIINNPDEAPRTLLFEGPFGTGKTSLARLFGRYLFGINDQIEDSKYSEKYNEIDMTIMGNDNAVQTLIDSKYSYPGKRQVIVLDEFHRTKPKVQQRFLIPFEDPALKVFTIMCTTNIELIERPIRSRSLEVKFTLAKPDILVNHLKEAAQKMNMNINDQVIRVIADRSKGHIRNAHMMMDNYRLIGETDFLEYYKPAVNLLCNYFIAIKEGDSQGILDNLNSLCLLPLEDIKYEFEEFIWLTVQAISETTSDNVHITRMIEIYGDGINQLIRLYYSDFFQNIFRSERDFQSGMLYLFETLSKS